MNQQTLITNQGNTTFNSSVKTLELTAEGVRLLDQTRLPHEVHYDLIQTPEAMAEAIQTMKVRGAPAIGIAGAFGGVLSLQTFIQNASQNGSGALDFATLKHQFAQDIEILRATRPTAVNLGWALDQLLALAPLAESPSALLDQVTAKAQAILAEDLAGNYQMGEFGKTFFPKGARVLTHCNAGALATAGYGTALGVIRSAFAQDPTVTVFADETRPRLQGARLTTWELIQDGIPVTLITDGMSGLLMKSGKVDLVIVGADRIAANGDTANKIGTYNLAIVAKAHGVPFYVAAPTSTFDLAIPDGTHIPIEERHGDEIAWTRAQQHPEDRLCAQGTKFYNPSFDVTPAEYITAIITERGIAKPPFQQSISQLF